MAFGWNFIPSELYLPLFPRPSVFHFYFSVAPHQLKAIQSVFLAGRFLSGICEIDPLPKSLKPISFGLPIPPPFWVAPFVMTMYLPGFFFFICLDGFFFLLGRSDNVWGGFFPPPFPSRSFALKLPFFRGTIVLVHSL